MEYLLYQEHFRQEWNNPSRSDYYAMQTAQVVAQKFADKPEKILLQSFKIPFSFEKQTPESIEEKKTQAEEFKRNQELISKANHLLSTGDIAKKSEEVKKRYLESLRKGQEEQKLKELKKTPDPSTKSST